MAWRGALGKGELSFFVDLVRRSGRTGQGVAVVEPLREVAIAAARGAERRELLHPRAFADGAALLFGLVGHKATACANPASTPATRWCARCWGWRG